LSQPSSSYPPASCSEESLDQALGLTLIASAMRRSYALPDAASS